VVVLYHTKMSNKGITKMSNKGITNKLYDSIKIELREESSIGTNWPHICETYGVDYPTIRAVYYAKKFADVSGVKDEQSNDAGKDNEAGMTSKDSSGGYTVKRTKTGALQYRHAGKLISKEDIPTGILAELYVD
jgi:hypothetical protein